MTSPDTKAQEIAYQEIPNRCWAKWSVDEQDNIIKKIAAALREWGEAEYKRGIKLGIGSLEEFKTDADRQHEIADAEGCRRGIEVAAKVADAEEELEGPIPAKNLEATLRDPELSLRAAVRCTKKNISRNIRTLLPSEGKGERHE